MPARKARPLQTPEDRRKRELARIHVLKAALGLDRDTYEAVLAVQCNGATSSASLSQGERQHVIAHLEQLLRRQNPKHKALGGGAKGRPHNMPDKATGPAGERGVLMIKIEALLADAGLPWGYADAILKQQTRQRKQRLAFADWGELHAVIAALEKAALKRLHQQAEDIWGKCWPDHVAEYAAYLDGFAALCRDITCYTRPVSIVIRWYQGTHTVACDWPVQLDAPRKRCCGGCLRHAEQLAGMA